MRSSTCSSSLWSQVSLIRHLDTHPTLPIPYLFTTHTLVQRTQCIHMHCQCTHIRDILTRYIPCPCILHIVAAALKGTLLFKFLPGAQLTFPVHVQGILPTLGRPIQDKGQPHQGIESAGARRLQLALQEPTSHGQLPRLALPGDLSMFLSWLITLRQVPAPMHPERAARHSQSRRITSRHARLETSGRPHWKQLAT